MSRKRVAIGLSIAMALTASMVAAAPLDKEECDKLKAEQVTLGTASVRGIIAKGPQWAKANVAQPQLTQVSRLIELDEQIAFRCPQPRLPRQRAEASEPAEAAAAASGEAKAETAPKKQRRTAARPATAVDSAAAAGQGGGEPVAQPAPEAAKSPRKAAAPKPKANDAYAAPAPAGNALETQAQRQPPAPAKQ